MVVGNIIYVYTLLLFYSILFALHNNMCNNIRTKEYYVYTYTIVMSM